MPRPSPCAVPDASWPGADEATGPGAACERPEGPADAEAAADSAAACCCSASSDELDRGDGDDEEAAPAAFLSLFFSLLLLASFERIDRSMVVAESERESETENETSVAGKRLLSPCFSIEIENEKRCRCPMKR